MNCQVFDLRELDVEHYQIREVLRCILHTIIFNRTFGLVRPRDVDSELFDITYVQCGDSATEKKIEEKIDHFCNWVEKHPTRNGQVCLSFFEKRNRQTSWFGTRAAQQPFWEQWCIHLHVLSEGREVPPAEGDSQQGTSEEEAEERSRRQVALEGDLREVLMQVLAIVNEKKEHIPPVASSDIPTFPYDITIPTSTDSAFGMDMFKRMLQSSPPQMLG